MPGLVLAHLQCAMNTGKGHICVDCTNIPDLAGSANTSIPEPNVANTDECSPVFYQHTFAFLALVHMTHLTRQQNPPAL
jgi:hypothetical protein